MSQMNLKPGEVWLADLGLAVKTRPVVIVSRLDPDPPRVLAIYVPLTTQYRGSAYEVALPELPFPNRDSFANVQGIGSVPTARLERKSGFKGRESRLCEMGKGLCLCSLLRDLAI